MNQRNSGDRHSARVLPLVATFQSNSQFFCKSLNFARGGLLAGAHLAC
jgi:hypothetical protein